MRMFLQFLCSCARAIKFLAWRSGHSPLCLYVTTRTRLRHSYDWYGGQEGHSEYECTSQTLYPALCKTGLRIPGSMADTYICVFPVSGFCDNGLRSPRLTTRRGLRTSTYEQIISLWAWLNPEGVPRLL